MVAFAELAPRRPDEQRGALRSQDGLRVPQPLGDEVPAGAPCAPCIEGGHPYRIDRFDDVGVPVMNPGHPDVAVRRVGGELNREARL